MLVACVSICTLVGLAEAHDGSVELLVQEALVGAEDNMAYLDEEADQEENSMAMLRQVAHRKLLAVQDMAEGVLAAVHLLVVPWEEVCPCLEHGHPVFCRHIVCWPRIEAEILVEEHHWEVVETLGN